MVVARQAWRRAGASGSARLGVIVLVSASVGALLAVVKGDDAGVRSAFGNMSAPWMVIPFVAGARYGNAVGGALAGIVATLCAFFGFYLAEAAVLDLGPHPWYVDLQLTLGSGRSYETLGLLSGSVYGGLGGLWRCRRLALGPLAVGLAFVVEPLIVWTLVRQGLWGGDGPLAHTWMWVGEVLVGLGLIAFVLVMVQTAQHRP